MAVVTSGVRRKFARDGRRNFADIAEFAWIWSIVGYSLLRFFIAWGAFAEHGANVWVFGIIDVGTAWPYAKAVATVCRRAAASEWGRLPVPLAVALVTFFAPYAYIWFSAGSMPDNVRLGMALCVGVLAVAATVGVLSKTRSLRRTTIDLRPTPVEVLADPSALVIDLTGETVEYRKNENATSEPV